MTRKHNTGAAAEAAALETNQEQEISPAMTKQERNAVSILREPLFPAMLRFALPVLGAIFLQTMYGAVDLLIVGQFAASKDVSAVSTGSWLMQLMLSFINGIAMGTTIQLGYRIGEGRPEEGGKVVGTSIALFALMALVLTVLMELFAVPLVTVMQAPEEAFSATLDYVRICSAGTIFIVSYNVLGGIFRGIGDSRMPLISVTIACITNILGDLLLVGVFRLEAAGAAYATVFAQAVSVVLSLVIIRHRKLPFTFHFKDIAFRWRQIGTIMKLGLPIAFQDVLVSLSFLVIQAIVNTLGVAASAGVGVAEKICGFIMLVPSAFGQAIAVFVAQNTGAGNPKRAKQSLWIGVATSFAVGVVMFWFSFFHGDLLARIFSNDAETIAAAAEYLKAYAVDCLLVSFHFCFNGYFNGREKTVFVMAEGITGAFLVRIPFSYFMSRLEPVSLFYIGLATPAASVVQSLACLIYYLILVRRDRQNAKRYSA